LSLSSADTLTVGSKELDGVFEGFAGRKFLFRTRDGKLHRQDRGSVRSLKLDKPREVDLFLSASRKSEKAHLLGYDKMSFTIQRNGRESKLSGMRVYKMEMEVPMFDDAAAARGRGTGPIPPLDLSGVEGASLTAEQSRALAAYKSARREYDAFLAESSRLVKEMDAATGAKRDELLNRLRRRKAEEQPVTRALQKAESALLAAIPEEPADVPEKVRENRPQGDRRPPQQGQAELPDVGDDGVLLLDVSGLAKMPDLNNAQSAAVKRYQSAARKYQELSGKTVTVENQAETDAALAKVTAEIKAAQVALLKAFPGLRFE